MRAEPGCGGEHEAAGDGLAIGPAPRDDRDRGERGAHPGRAGGRSDDAFDGAVGAARRPVIALRADLKVVVAAHPIDFRKSVHTLSALVSEALHANPYCGDVFVFRSKRMDRVKLLAWDGSGMVLVTKWLHQGPFTLPRQRLRSIPQTTTADQKPRSGKLEYCQKPNQRCNSGVPCSS